MFRFTFVFACLLGAAPAAAQELNRQAFPVGETAIGTGGAYTGRAEDASAAYYNPGGLALGRQGSVGVSLSLSLLDDYRVGAYDSDSTPLEYSDALGVPFYAGGAIQAGDHGIRHGFAVATFAPNRVDRRFTLASQGMGDTRSLEVHRADRTRWYGISYGIRPIEGLGVGLSAFLATRQFRHEEGEIVGAGTSALYTRLARVDLTAELIIFRVGALWELDPTFSLGLMVQPPSIVVGGRATVSGTQAGASMGMDVDSRFVAEDIGADSPLPFQARAGASWRPDPALMLNADVIVEGPLGSASDPIERLRIDPAEPQIFGSYLATRYHSDWVVDFAVGGRGVIENLVPISAGVFSSFSAAPSPEPGAVYQPDRRHVLGASLGVGVRTDEIDFAIGVVGAYGFGEGLVANAFRDLSAPDYRLADVQSQSIFLYLIGAGGTAKVLGRRVAEEILGRDGDSEDEEAEANEGAPADEGAGSGAGAEADEGADTGAGPGPGPDAGPGADRSAETDEADDAEGDDEPPPALPEAAREEEPPPTVMPDPDEL